MKLLITGASGMLAGHLASILVKGSEHSVVWSDIAPPRPFLSPHPLADTELTPMNICDPAEVRHTVHQLKPDWIINCAAYTAVDLAESDPKSAFEINSTGPLNLAVQAREVGARLLHISSDYVFGSYVNQTIPFSEESALKPIGVYGQSKALGDENVLAGNPEGALILRTSWLHGLYGPNFVDTILKAGRERPELTVVNDQIGSPTWAGWLAEIILRAISSDLRGVYHSCGFSNGISWFDFATKIALHAGLPCKVSPQSSTELKRPAPRPPYSLLDTTKLREKLGLPPVSWEAGLCEHLALRGAVKSSA